VLGIELEDLAEVTRRAHPIADLADADESCGDEVLDLLLGTFRELGELGDDVDQAVPVLLLAIELHEPREETAVVGPLFESSYEALGRVVAITDLLGGDFADVDEQLDARVAVGVVELAHFDADDLGPVLRLSVGLGEAQKGALLRRIELEGFLE